MTQQADDPYEPILARARDLASMPQPAVSEALDVLERGLRLAEERRLSVRGY